MQPQTELFERPVISRAVERIRAHEDAKRRAEAGMNAAADKADRVNHGWCDQAVEALRRFAASQHGMFLIETARVILAPEFPRPPDARAWGKATQLAAKAGYIERVPKVFLPAASSNAAPKPAWRRGANA